MQIWMAALLTLQNNEKENHTEYFWSPFMKNLTKTIKLKN